MSNSILFVRALVEATERAGVSRQRFLEAAGFDPGKLHQSDARVTLAEFDALLDLAVTLTGDEAFGLHMAEGVTAETYNVSAYVVAHASSLRDGIDSMLRFHRLLTARPYWRLVEEGDTASLLYDLKPGASNARRLRIELTVTSFYLTFRHFAGSARPRRVGFDYPAPAYRAEYTRVFGGTERFEQPLNGVVFDRDLLGSAPIHRDPELHAAIVAHAEKRMAKVLGDVGYAERVRQHVLEHGTAPDQREMDVIARALGLSARSLRRRLQDEGVAFRDVMDGALGVLAKRMVTGEDRPIEAIAYDLGFAHASAFHRAFKRWTGETPAACRSRRRTT